MRIRSVTCYALAFALLCAALTAACTGSDAPAPATDPEPTQPPTTAAQASPSSVPATAAPSRTLPTAVPSADEQEANDALLIEASRRGRLDDVRQLLARGASAKASDGDGVTALIAAAYGAQLEIARELIAAGADVNVQDNTKQSAYLIASSEIGDSPRAIEFLRLVLANGADVTTLGSYNGTGLIRAADRGYTEIVAILLNTATNRDHVNNLGWTALLEAIILGGGDARHVEVVRLLVAAGANVNLADGSGVSPLSHARSRGYTEMVRILEAAGAR